MVKRFSISRSIQVNAGLFDMKSDDIVNNFRSKNTNTNKDTQIDQQGRTGEGLWAGVEWLWEIKERQVKMGE